MAKTSTPSERPGSKLKQVVVSNLQMLKDHRAREAGRRLKEYYDRWDELSDLERAHVFRLEAEQHGSAPA
jgi:hypothetical protein